jgi:hypothetical protein
MNDFRPETFFQFIGKTKPIWFLKVIWAFAFMFLTLLFFWIYKSKPDVFWSYCLFIVVGLTLQAGYMYLMTYKIYNLGRQAFLQIKNEDLKIVSDVSIYVKGFDLFSKKSFFNINADKPMYDFNQADLILGQESIILLGKSNQFGSALVAAPVEIFISNPETSIAHARLINWEDERDRLQIEIKDDYYTKPFKIEFKNHYEEIKLWLTSGFVQVGQTE